MPSANLTLLSRVLRERRRASQTSYILIIGSGRQFDLEHRKRIAHSVIGSEDVDILDTAMASFSEMERYLTLRKQVETLAPSPGYQYIADLIQQKHFDLVLTCQIDRSLEDALLDTQLRSSDYVVLVNGLDEPARILDSLTSVVPRVKIVKVYGDFTLRRFAFTHDETMRFCDQLSDVLGQCLREHILVVNLASRDLHLLRHLPRKGSTVWYAGEGGLAEALEVCPYLKARNPIVIDGTEARVETFFEALHSELLGRSLQAFWELLGITEVWEGTPDTQFTQLPELFVPPEGFDEILDVLEQEHFAVITGEPHVGKTYTAFYTLWQFFRQGFRPIFLPGDELMSPRGGSYLSFRTFLRKYLRDGHVVHLDDPFGKTRFLPNEELLSNLHSFVIEAKRANVRVLITSRKSILHQAIGVPPPAFLERLIVSLGFYTLEQRREILQRYMALYNPVWAESPDVRTCLDTVPALLVAPHNIELFVRGTVSCEHAADALSRARDFNDLQVELGRMISGFDPHEILFHVLVSSLASKFLPVKECRRLYQEAWDRVREALTSHSRVFMPWGACIHRFGSQLITRLNWDGEPYHTFYHPVYTEAIARIIKEEPRVAALWSVALGGLATDGNPYARRAAASDICQYCPAEHWELVSALADDPDAEVRAAVAASIWSALDLEPWSILEKLSGDPSVLPRRAISEYLIRHWDHLPESVSQECLKVLLSDRVEWTRLAIAQELVACYTEGFKPVLVEMAIQENEFLRVVLANELLTHYRDDFAEVLEKLIEVRDDLATEFVAHNAGQLAGLIMSPAENSERRKC